MIKTDKTKKVFGDVGAALIYYVIEVNTIKSSTPENIIELIVFKKAPLESEVPVGFSTVEILKIK